MLPRGLRNNNPGNIDYNKNNAWLGQVGIETGLPVNVKPRFAKFSSMEYGIRALCKLLQTYKNKHKLNTIRKIASRYAPPNENATSLYAKHVSEWSGLGIDSPLDLENIDTLVPLVNAIIRKENGINPVPIEVVRKGCELAV